MSVCLQKCYSICFFMVMCLVMFVFICHCAETGNIYCKKESFTGLKMHLMSHLMMHDFASSQLVYIQNVPTSYIRFSTKSFCLHNLVWAAWSVNLVR